MEETPLEKIFGESAALKILDILMKHPSMDYSKKELAEVTGIAESTVHRNWDKIEEMDAVEKTRKYGKTQLYRLNQDSEVVKQLFKLDQELRDREEVKERKAVSA
ncbi:MAG: winged helix-turn-helix domain-containing protein [Candidatus Nanohaloarchaea archaeon]